MKKAALFLFLLAAPAWSQTATVLGGYGTTEDTVTLTTGGGNLFQSVPFAAYWWDSSDFSSPLQDPNVEGVAVLQVNGDVLSVQRAYGTQAFAHNTPGVTYSITFFYLLTTPTPTPTPTITPTPTLTPPVTSTPTWTPFPTQEVSVIGASAVTTVVFAPGTQAVTLSNQGYCSVNINNVTGNPSDNGMNPTDGSVTLPIYLPAKNWPSAVVTTDFFNTGLDFVDVLHEGYVPVGGVRNLVLNALDPGLPATVVVSWSFHCLPPVVHLSERDHDQWLKGQGGFLPSVHVVFDTPTITATPTNTFTPTPTPTSTPTFTPTPTPTVTNTPTITPTPFTDLSGNALNDLNAIATAQVMNQQIQQTATATPVLNVKSWVQNPATPDITKVAQASLQLTQVAYIATQVANLQAIATAEVQRQQIEQTATQTPVLNIKTWQQNIPTPDITKVAQSSLQLTQVPNLQAIATAEVQRQQIEQTATATPVQNIKTWLQNPLVPQTTPDRMIGDVSLGNTLGKTVVMKTGFLVTTSTTANQIVLTYTVTTGKTFYLEYFVSDSRDTSIPVGTGIDLGDVFLESPGGTALIQDHPVQATSGNDNFMPYHFPEPIPIASGTVIRVTVTPSAVTSITWIANFGGYEK